MSYKYIHHAACDTPGFIDEAHYAGMSLTWRQWRDKVLTLNKLYHGTPSYRPFYVTGPVTITDWNHKGPRTFRGKDKAKLFKP